jgi:hypothetical protein
MKGDDLRCLCFLARFRLHVDAVDASLKIKTSNQRTSVNFII